MTNHIKFSNGIELEIEFRKSAFVNDWLELCKQRPVDSLILDTTTISVERFNFLRHECDQMFGWNWSSMPLTQENFNLMHKDIEALKIGNDRMEGANHPLHELHTLLHSLEGLDLHNLPKLSRNYLKFRSYHSDRLPITDLSVFQRIANSGSVILDYPYVGRSPLETAKYKDESDLLITCIPAFEACAGFMINIDKFFVRDSQIKLLTDWLDNNGRPIADKYGRQKIIDTMGHPVVGQVINVSDLESFRTEADLQVLDMDF